MKDDVLFDSDKCIWKRDFGYDSMSLKEFDEYANIAATFTGHFVGNYEHLSIEMNRLEKTFRLVVNRNYPGTDEYGWAFALHGGYYQSGNVKWLDNFFGILNNEYGLAANNLRIPKYPTNSADGYYEWYILARQFRNFRIDFKDITNSVYDKISNLRDKYFEHWIIPGSSRQ